MAQVCIVDDQALLRDSLSSALTKQDHTVFCFDNAQEALTHMRQQEADVVVTDLRMPGMDGISLLKEMRRLGLDTPVVLMTAHASVETAVEAMKHGAFDYLTKPFNAEELSILIERSVRERNLVRENEAMKRTLEDLQKPMQLVGRSAAITPVFEKIERVAQSTATVLISGPSGVGKEMIARAIHAASPRRDKPMLAVNCAALAPSLLESELFGHEKGSFTGADRTRKGRFELADGGTLLLDEVSELDMSLQAKLLRVLQEREFERVGSSVTRRVDVRVIATTNRDLRDWCAKAKFREDLFYRLSVLPVEVPAIRERSDDIPLLLEHFIERTSQREGKPRPQLTADALRALVEYPWPGNVRELQNFCERMCVLEAGRTIDPDTIRPMLNGLIKVASKPVVNLTYRDGSILADAERDLIERALARFHGHRERTARALGIGLRTLGLKIKKWREEGTFQEPYRRNGAFDDDMSDDSALIDEGADSALQTAGV
ncbi:MAG: sigma-54 dependent transcriptional regulator [Phycisphaerae bacterium]|nr:sigma-54 dependent transcriptional regulator [Phycisphaerae bacterium]